MGSSAFRRQEASGVALCLPGTGELLLAARLDDEVRVAAPGTGEPLLAARLDVSEAHAAAPGAGEPLGVVLGGEARVPCAVPGLEGVRFVPGWVGAGRAMKGFTRGGSGDGLGSAGFLRTRSMGPR